MAKNKEKYALIDPFPTQELRNLDFGNADGHRDELVEDAFIPTSSIKKFLLNRHSIVVGPIGSGKSALFKLLKNKSPKLAAYAESMIVSIEEAVKFDELRELVTNYFPSRDAENIFPLVWKFLILRRISEEISKCESFPSDDNEKYINKFIKDTGGVAHCESIVDRLKSLFSNFDFTIDATIDSSPVKAKVAAKTGKQGNELGNIKLNLDKVLSSIELIAENRDIDSILVIIDKIDSFVAGEDYETQRQYIESLLEIEDDLFATKYIRCKIFIRSDLFTRLSFAKLGRAKVRDNTVDLAWSGEEVILFIAARIYKALDNAGLLSLQQVFETTNLSNYEFDTVVNRSPFSKLICFVGSFFGTKCNEGSDSEIGMIDRLHRAIVTKAFPRTISHVDKKGNIETVSIFEFLQTHFKDGHGVTTPRYLLVFLKEVQEAASKYYDSRPNILATVVEIEGDLEWKLFKEKSVYNAYKVAKDEYIKDIGNTEDVWAKHFVVFMARKGNKTTFNYKWVRENIQELNESGAIDFLAFLQVIGFLKVKKHHSELKKRDYEIPILYKKCD